MSKRPSRGVSSGIGSPTKMTGRDGDLTIRKTKEGKILYVKEHGSWHPINTGVDTAKLKKDVDRLIRSVNTLRNDNNPFPTINSLNIRKDKIKLGTDGTGLTLKNNSGALNIRNEADSADVQLAVGYGGTGLSTFTGADRIIKSTGATTLAATQTLPSTVQGNINSVGTISSGTWQGTAVAATYVGELPTSKITSGTFDDARIAASNVTQHVNKAYVDGLDITEVGALADGSIASGFGAIDNGASNITTTGTLSTGLLHASKNFSGISNNSIVKISGTTTAPGSPTSEATINALEIIPTINATPSSGANTQTFNLIKADLTETNTTSFDVVNLLDIQVTDSGGSKASKFKINNTGGITSTGTASNSDGSSGDNRYLHITTDGLIGYRTAAQIKGDVGGTAASSTFTDVIITGTSAPQLTVGYDADNKATISVATDGETTIATADSADANVIIDSAGDIELNADGGNIVFKDGTTEILEVTGTAIQLAADNKISFDSGADEDYIYGDNTNIYVAIGDSDILQIGASKIKTEAPFIIKEDANATADTAGYGQVWVKNSTPNELCFTDDAGTDITGIGKYIYDIQRVGYYSTSAGSSYLPLTGYVLEKTSTSGNNEFIAFVAPYNGTLEKIMWRSEIAQDGVFRNLIYESSDGTEVPGSAIGRWDVTVDVADDTTVEFDFTATPTSGTNVFTKGKIYAISIDPASAPNDTNATVVFKWDITS